MKEFKIGIIGLGARARYMLRHVVEIEGTTVTALCDLYDDRIEQISDSIFEAKGYRPDFVTKDYKELIDAPCVDVVLIFAAWEIHVPASIYAMEKGKPVGVEVGGAYSLKQCWDLVKTYEKTKTPIMMLENCCYGRREMMILNMVQKGVFGTVVHCDGAYGHDLRDQVATGEEKRHYRMRNYKHRNCDNYPTHELGPIAKILNINHGNRLLTLSSMASKSAGVQELIKEKYPENEALQKTEFMQGDVVTTIISCAGGETIRLTLDTSLPRFYSRDFNIHGTKALYTENNDSLAFDSMDHKTFETWHEHWGNAKEYEEEYDHPVWKKYIEDGVKAGHGGMDWLVLSDFFDALKNGTPMPIDVYDTATWMAITPLTEESIAKGGAPVSIPDFTNGNWIFEK